jgi:hypothetical protein
VNSFIDPKAMENMRRIFRLLHMAVTVFACFSCTNLVEESSDQIPFLEKHGTATRLVVHGEPFLMISGELHNSTAGGLETMRPVWRKMAHKNLNSVIATVSWELVEPEERVFDFTLLKFPGDKVTIQKISLYHYK